MSSNADDHTDVLCPHCFARYRIGSELFGPGGARVRCPRCQSRFDVTPPREPSTASHRDVHAPVSGARPAARDAAAIFEPPHATLEDVLDRLTGEAPGIADAWRSGRLFTAHGAALLEAFDEYRRRAGAAADPAAFRAALRRRFGIALDAGADAPADRLQTSV